MGLGQKRNRLLVPEASAAMNRFKYEIAHEVGLDVQDGSYWGNYTSRDCGAVGGHMVRQMIDQYERSLAGQGMNATTTPIPPSKGAQGAPELSGMGR